MKSISKQLSVLLALALMLGSWTGLAEEAPAVENLQSLVRLSDGWLLQGMETI